MVMAVVALAEPAFAMVAEEVQEDTLLTAYYKCLQTALLALHWAVVEAVVEVMTILEETDARGMLVVAGLARPILQKQGMEKHQMEVLEAIARIMTAVMAEKAAQVLQMARMEKARQAQ